MVLNFLLFKRTEYKKRIPITLAKLYALEHTWVKERNVSYDSFPPSGLHPDFFSWIRAQGVNVLNERNNWFLVTDTEENLTAFVLKWF